MAVSEILNDIQKAMLSSLEDGDGEYDWTIEDDYISVTTRFSRDTSRSNNGGDYCFYRRYQIVDGGGVKAWDDWSCDFADYSQYGGSENFYHIAIRDLGRVAHLAEARALAKWEEQAEPACPFCGGSLKEIFASIDEEDDIREIVRQFIERKVGFKELKAVSS